MLSAVFLSLSFGLANAHLAAWHRGMYCLNGSDGNVDLNAAAPVTPLYQLPQSQWWFHHINKCDEFPPAPGDFLDLPAGGQFQVEIASNRAKTSLSYNGRDMSDWPDGGHYPDNYAQSDIKQVTPKNLVVFSVRYHTPWKRVTTYDVPANMPACPPDGCICAWGWVPNGCGQPNMYHQAFRCRITGAHSTTPLADPKPPVWCEGEPDKCTKGAKQMLYWNQQDGNNIVVSGLNLAGQPKSPAYNMNTGFADGAQNDIFAGPSSSNGGSNNSNNNTPRPTNSSPAGPPHASPTSSTPYPRTSVAAIPQAPVSNTVSASTNPSAVPSPSTIPTTSDTSDVPYSNNIPTTSNPPTCRSKKSRFPSHGSHKKELHKNRLNAKSW
ncbi:hypothetical protein AN958_02909 [Leucoagaricus sp. SymC.cos]|nr:hypothetical protein AN958_02909 [Leucoagaricus sp. SymC.cos]